ncbi:DUF4097 family beta strand repeat protein [Hymenobacter taeanensis]|uniref:DUF4097 family beta strand repeat protein n=1 Tax=Hymenobacter taeanensis TaxID=2735321 RepID=A0A6M6BDQ7_9BACT|nr:MULTISPECIES: DUF4097 family beta strand repeat-containing protein [Hymenobacter]QJX46089.1 DUF4097 family beta strand repeat protein [Hymenobacter taeanensis]UOQ79943.1 DUF4097 family beta strand repeat-containing protein [Hymenobacter sp. 5414T-23]
MSSPRNSAVLSLWPWRLLSIVGLLAVVAGPVGAQTASDPAMGPAVHYYPQPKDTAWPQGQSGPDNICQGSTAQGPQDDAQAPTVEKVRRLSRTFKAMGKPYTLDTRYGRVQVNVWSRNEVRTDVDIITRSDTEEKAQQLQEMINVQVAEKDPATDGISVKSRFGAMPRECWSRTKLYEVNYTVWVPKNTPLHLHNSFGEVILTGDVSGITDLAVEYGTLRTARLEGSRNLVRVNNGQCAMSYVRTASIDASYSKLRLTAGDVVDLRNNSSDIDIGTVKDLTVHSKYGDVALGNVSNLRGTSGYSKFSVDKLSNQLDMTVQFCPNFEVRSTGKNFRQINVDGGYSTIQLNFPDEAAFKFDVNTEHGKLLVDKRLVRVDSEESSASSSDMQGSFGSVPTRAGGNVNIKVRYGNVSFNK